MLVSIAICSVAVYLFVILAIRFFGKKELTQLSVVDLAILEVDGNISVLSSNFSRKTKKRRLHKSLSFSN